MKQVCRYILLFLMLVVTAGITLPAQPAEESATDDAYILAYYSQVLGFEIKQIQNINLFDIVDYWINTPYRYAGQGENGIDCSRFVITVFASAMNRYLEGNSAELFTQCIPAKKQNLCEGDLVFFKIRSKRISHVGIYLAGNKFVHSSTKAGVIISDLNEPYYKRYFTSGGRLK